MLDFQLVGIPDRERGLGLQCPRRPVLFDTRSWLNVTLRA